MTPHSSAFSPPPPHAPKAQWRSAVRAYRSENLMAMPQISAQVAERTASLLRSLGAQTVLAYHAMSGEPDLSALGGEGFRLLTTRARVRPERRLTVHEWAAATERSPFGVLQPPRDAPEVLTTEIDAVLLPGLAFDRAGFRLGYGGGFYDRFLAELAGMGWDGPTIGVTPAALLLGALPHEAHDLPLRWLVSESETVEAAL